MKTIKSKNIPIHLTNLRKNNMRIIIKIQNRKIRIHPHIKFTLKQSINHRRLTIAIHSHHKIMIRNGLFLESVFPSSCVFPCHLFGLYLLTKPSVIGSYSDGPLKFPAEAHVLMIHDFLSDDINPMYLYK